MVIKLIRHGESLANTGDVLPHLHGDYNVPLSDKGRGAAAEAGQRLGRQFIENSLIYCSPYRRTRETLDEILEATGLDRKDLHIYEDPRIREAERGYEDDQSQYHLREVHGWFYYRHKGGESPADCYDRISTFLESMMRQVERRDCNRVLVVTHGMTIRCFVMRFLRLTVEQFEMMKNPGNCEIVTLAAAHSLPEHQFQHGWWAVDGLEFEQAD